MKATQLSAPQQTLEIELPMPHVGPHDVLLKTNYVGLCGSDLNSYLGKNPLVNYPVIPGHELAATIVQVGKEVPVKLK